MREIKFRIYDPVGENMDYSPETFTGWLNDNFDFDGYAEGEEPIVMQYTGLKDKNGKEIYEGDVLRHEEITSWYGAGVTEVVYSDKKARFEVTKSIGFSHKDLGDQLRNNMIVIGNIYENPELLEVVKL